ncbi:MAG: NHL repeat-containing protein [Thermomicrobiales bacterium]
MSNEDNDVWDHAAAVFTRPGASQSRRDLLGAAATGFALAASGLLLPERLVDAADHPARRLQKHTAQRRGTHRHALEHRRDRHRNRRANKGEDKPGGGSGTDDQGFVFVGSTTDVRGPVGLAVGGGRLFVANAASNSEAVRLFGISAKGQLTRQGGLPDGFNFAVAVDLDAAGRLYVADLFGLVRVYAIHDDGGAHRIAEIRASPDRDGVAVAVLPLRRQRSREQRRSFRIVNGDPPTYEPVATIGGFNKPGQLAYDGGRLYVADPGNQRVQVYGIDGGSGEATFKRTIPIPNPGGIAVGGGQLYVSCSRSGSNQRSRVQVFDLDADGVTTPGVVLTKGDQSFMDPRGLALGRGFLFVADSGNNRVQVFRIP